MTSTELAVVAGELIGKVISVSTVKIAAGVGFMLIGLWTVVSA